MAVQQNFLRIVHGYPNAFRFSITGADLSEKRFLVRLMPMQEGTLADSVSITEESGVVVDTADPSKVTINFTNVQSSKWDLEKRLRCYLSIFNEDNSLFAKGDWEVKVSA